ncbi:adenylate kinase [Halovenus rubra]|uniref:Adenylate kinase n=2 Tax=Halovenus rubra TaxID=869890 RepID=A0ACC7DXX7_9EURY|nr:adenylate kinase [Halovenus rubra]
MTAPKILIMGPPGAGKGTQCSNIVDAYDVEHITTGDALRSNKQMDISDMDTEYDTPAEYMDAGDLVPDQVVNAIVEKALNDADGFVLDGYPRNPEQNEELDSMTDLDVVLSVSVGNEELLDRLTGRRVDPETGDNYHVKYDMPDDEEVRERLIQREDDTQEAAENRLDVFDENTKPVIESYHDQSEFVEIDGEQSPDDVWTDIKQAIDEQTDA